MRFIHSENRVICLMDYKGKTIRGTATCHPEDTFDIKYGEELAKLRCLEKLKSKQVKEMSEKFVILGETIDYLENTQNKTKNSLINFSDKQRKIEKEIEKLIKKGKLS